MGFLDEHKDRLKRFLDRLTNDAHVPIAIFVFCVTFAYVAHTGKDIPPGFVSSLYAFYGFLGGHALVYQKWPDPTNPTVDVNVTNDNSNTNSNSANANANSTPAAPAAPAQGNGSNDTKG
jgi:hypothetical protein